MRQDHKVSCVLCQRSEETKITGALSTKDEVTAHQNCLLFSSGIYCRDSPQFDDLFGFSVEDVMNEVKRGSKLTCNKCKKKGATAGCEVKRCKKSYHYPCAVQEGAEIFEETDKGNYGLYCFKHQSQTQNNNCSVNGCASSPSKPQTSKNCGEAGSSKEVYCLSCEKTEGNIRLESLSNSIIMLYCEKHAPSSHTMSTNKLPACSSDSDASSSATRLTSKRRSTFNDKEEETASKRKSEGWKRRISDSDEDGLNGDMEMFAPLEFDLDDSANSVPESQLIRKDTESPAGSTSGNPPEDESRDGDKDEDETNIVSDAESESLLLPVEVCVDSQLLSEPSSAVSTPAAPNAHPSGDLVKEVKEGDDEAVPAGSPPCTSSAISPPPETTCVSVLSSSPSVPSPDPELGIDSASFWKSCNAAACTQAIFTGFINKMNEISSRIQSGQASQEDYDLALKVMSASGKLPELVAKQQKELQRKQMELQKATVAMKDVVSALKR